MYDPWTLTKWGECRWTGGAGWKAIREGEWDNCNSIINKIHLKSKIKSGLKSSYRVFPINSEERFRVNILLISVFLQFSKISLITSRKEIY